MDKFLTFINNMVDRAGIRPVIAALLSGGFLYLAWHDKIDALYAMIGSIILFVVMSIFRHFEKNNSERKKDAN